MPARYLTLKSQMLAKGKSNKLAKKHSAMIENALRRKEGKPPMTPHREK